MYLSYLQNDFIFSGLFGILSLVLAFLDSKRNKKKYTFKNYLAIFLCVSVCVYQQFM